MMKSILLRSIGLLGVILFAALFAVTFLSSETIENSAKGFVKSQIEKEVREKYDQGLESDIAKSALTIAENLGLETENIVADLENNLPEKIANVIAAMCGYDCERKKAITQSITASYLDRLRNIEIAQDTLGNIIRDKYLEIIGNLKVDLRIFLGSNLG